MKAQKKPATSLLVGSLLTLHLFFLNAEMPAKEQKEDTFSFQSFMGTVCHIVYASPGLDFVVATQERPGQNYLIENIQNQPFEYIWAHREFKSKNAQALAEIKGCLYKGYESGGIKVIIYGEYSTDITFTMGRSDGYLKLTSIQIFIPDGRFYITKTYSLDGVVGGVNGCSCQNKKKEKNLCQKP